MPGVNFLAARAVQQNSVAFPALASEYFVTNLGNHWPWYHLE